MSKTVSFTAMKDGTREEYALLARLEKPFLALTADRVLDELRRADEVTLEGYKISRLTHGLQSATRAMRDGADIDWVVGALLHDIGDGLAPQNHDRMSAKVIRPLRALGCGVGCRASWHFPNALLCPSLRVGPRRARAVSRPSLFRQLRGILRTMGSIQL